MVYCLFANSNINEISFPIFTTSFCFSKSKVWVWHFLCLFTTTVLWCWLQHFFSRDVGVAYTCVKPAQSIIYLSRWNLRKIWWVLLEAICVLRHDWFYFRINYDYWQGYFFWKTMLVVILCLNITSQFYSNNLQKL